MVGIPGCDRWYHGGYTRKVPRREVYQEGYLGGRYTLPYPPWYAPYPTTLVYTPLYHPGYTLHLSCSGFTDGGSLGYAAARRRSPGLYPEIN